MILAQHSGNCLGILAQTLELIDDQMSGIFLVSILDLFLRQAAHAGNRSVDVICLGGSVAGNVSSRLCPTGSIGRMGMHDTADLRERLVQLQMSCSVGRGIQIPFHLITVQIHDYHHLRCQLVIIHTTGFDHEQSTLSVNGADISPGESHQTIPGQIHICFIYFLF